MDYEILKAAPTEEKIAAYAKLLSQVFAGTDKFSTQFLDWQYRQNPAGIIEGADAYFNGELAAHYATIPVLYTINGTQTKGLLSLNTATHPSHQGKGLFTKLAAITYEEGRKAGYEFVIGVANQNSTPGFIKKLGFTLVTPLSAKIGFGKIKFDSAANYAVKALWNNEMLNWRLANPSATYFKNGDTFISPTDKFGIDAQLKWNNEPSNGLLDLKQKSSLAKIWIGIANEKTERGLFFNLPDALRPSPLNLIFKDLTGKLPLIKKEDVFFELIDFDAY